MPEEYPFAEYVQVKDKDIVEDRLHPREVEEDTARMRERMEAIQREI